MLTSEQVDKIRAMFSTAGWADVVKPALENRIRQRIRLLILEPSERGDNPLSDKTIRGALMELEWLLMSFQNELIVAESNRLADELDRASQRNGTEEIGTGPPANP